MLGKLPGYRRASRYVLEAKNPLTQGEPPMYLAIHYVDDIHSFEGKNFDAINVTPWTLKHLDEAKVAVMRMWDKVYDHGF